MAIYCQLRQQEPAADRFNKKYNKIILVSFEKQSTFSSLNILGNNSGNQITKRQFLG